MGKAKQMVEQMGPINNQTQAMEMLAAQNPALRKTLDTINEEYGGDPRAAFLDRARKMGYNV